MSSSAPIASTSSSVVAGLAGRLRDTARRVGDTDALRWQDRRLSYAELDASVDRAAAGLSSLGVERGDRVAIVLSNTPAFVQAWYAVLRLGAVAVPAAPALAPDELRHVLEDSGSTVAVVAASVAAPIDALRETLPSLRSIVVADQSDQSDESDQPDGAAEAADHTWGQLLELGADGDAGPDLEHDADELAALVYTSGTTGRPRGAMLTVGNLASNQDQSLAVKHRLEQDDVVLAVLPLFHIYGLNVVLGTAVAIGATVVLQDRFDAATTARLIADEGVTVLPGAPPMFVAWAQQPPDGLLDGLRLCASGAAPLAPSVSRAFTEVTGVPVHEGYGLTEAAPAVTSSAQDDEVLPGSVGRPLPGVELRLVGDGEDVLEGDPGEVWVRGPNVFAGYWHDEQATARALTDDGWLRTGDVGVMDDRGWLHLVDRHTDLIIVSGFNVYPREVERVLLLHPAVARAAVVGAPHPATGETPVAHVVRAGDVEIVEDDLDAHCRRQLARYKCPTSYRVVADLPTTITGKIRRTDLRLD